MEGEIIMTKKANKKEDTKETDSKCQHKIVELEARIVDLEKHCK